MMTQFVPMSPRLSSPMHPSSGGGGVQGGGGGGGGGRGRGRGEDRRNNGIIGQTVRIVQGPYKGKDSISGPFQYIFFFKDCKTLG